MNPQKISVKKRFSCGNYIYHNTHCNYDDVLVNGNLSSKQFPLSSCDFLLHERELLFLSLSDKRHAILRAAFDLSLCSWSAEDAHLVSASESGPCVRTTIPKRQDCWKIVHQLDVDKLVQFLNVSCGRSPWLWQLQRMTAAERRSTKTNQKAPEPRRKSKTSTTRPGDRRLLLSRQPSFEEELSGSRADRLAAVFGPQEAPPRLRPSASPFAAAAPQLAARVGEVPISLLPGGSPVRKSFASKAHKALSSLR